MTTLITVNDGSGDSVSPTLVLGYQVERESQNIVHQIIGGGIAVTLVRPNPRTGTLELFFLEEADAFDAADKHAAETTFTLSDTDRPSINMTYVVSGSVYVELDPETRNRWLVSVDFQEVETS